MRISTPVLAAIIAVLLLGIVALNMAIKPVGDDHDHEQEDEKPAATQTSSGSEGSSTGANADALVRLPVDYTAGPSNAHDTVVVGWLWTPEVQADPQLVYQAIKEVEKSASGANVRIVNGDAVPDAPLGVVVNGKTVLPLPANGLLTPDEAKQAIQQALAGHSH